MKERLIEFLAYLKIGQFKFEEKVGLSRGFVNKVGDSITLSTANKILSAYPELNKDWLLNGEGEMIKNNQRTGDISNSTVVGANVNGSGNNITHNDIAGLIELQKGYQEMIKKKEEQIDKLLDIINKIK
jgi:hypothetical protein